MRDMRLRSNITRSVVSGSGPPSASGFSTPSFLSSYDGLP